MALPSTPTTSLLPCSVLSERPRHLKFLSASHWLAQSGLSGGSAPPPPGWSAPLHLPTPHLCWLSNLPRNAHRWVEARSPYCRAGSCSAGAASHLPDTATHGTNGPENPVCRVFGLSVWKMSRKDVSERGLKVVGLGVCPGRFCL